MSTYKEYRDLHKNVNVYKLLVANEVYDTIIDDSLIGLNLTDEDYETICEYVYEYTDASQMSVNELVNIIHAAILSETQILDYILDGSWEAADEIVYTLM